MTNDGNVAQESQDIFEQRKMSSENETKYEETGKIC